MNRKNLALVCFVICGFSVAVVMLMRKSVQAPAPTTGTTNGVVRGQVLLGPICPVERIPPDPGCAPKPLQTMIDISQNIETPDAMMTIASDASGSFMVTLPAGEYVFHPRGQAHMRCDEDLISVIEGSTTSTIINCDTGIR